MRRTPWPMLLSDTMMAAPTSPVWCTWVPPQSSRDQPPKSTTRTFSVYFSSSSAIAPLARASGSDMTSTRALQVGADVLVDARLDVVQLLAGERARLNEKSKVAWSGPTKEPRCTTPLPSTSRSAWLRKCVALWWRATWARRSASTTARTLAPVASVPSSTRTVWTRAGPA